MARSGRPERNRAARSFRQLRRFYHIINTDRVFGTHSSLRFGYVGHMDHGVFETVAVEGFAAGALHQRTRFLRRKPLTGLPHRIFSRSPVSLIAPSLKIGIGAFRQKHPPGSLEIGAGFVEVGGGAILMFARMRAWIEAASPLPRILVVWAAAADRDRAGMHVAVVDVPTLLGGISRAAAGKFGHVPSKRGTCWRATASGYCRSRVSTGASHCSAAGVYTATMENLPTLAEWFATREHSGARLGTLTVRDSWESGISLNLSAFGVIMKFSLGLSNRWHGR